jgi:hypothetical protein
MTEDIINYEVTISGQVGCTKAEKERIREKIESAIDSLVDNYEVLLEPMDEDEDDS